MQGGAACRHGVEGQTDAVSKVTPRQPRQRCPAHLRRHRAIAGDASRTSVPARIRHTAAGVGARQRPQLVVSCCTQHRHCPACAASCARRHGCGANGRRTLGYRHSAGQPSVKELHHCVDCKGGQEEEASSRQRLTRGGPCPQQGERTGGGLTGLRSAAPLGSGFPSPQPTTPNLPAAHLWDSRTPACRAAPLPAYPPGSGAAVWRPGCRGRRP